MAKYIHRTKFLRLTIKAAYLDQNHWFFKAAVVVHDNVTSHIGAYATFGKSMINCWERVNMDPGLDPSGRPHGPVIQTYTMPF